jgi:KDO2-lipid IV(A) lauroyltransferase
MIRAPVVRAFVRLFAFLPLPVAHALGAALGVLGAVVPSSFARRTRFHIARCLPELASSARRWLAFRALVEAGKTLTELPFLFAAREARVVRALRAVHGRELLDAAVAAGKGVVAVSPHLGAWEMTGLAFSREVDGNCVSMYRPQVEPWDSVLKEGRERFGAKLAPSDRSGMRQLLDMLRHGGSIGVLPDQDPPAGSGVFAPFFDIIAHSPTLPTRIARRTGATILYVYAERLGWGRGFILHIEPAPPEVADEDEVRAVAAVNRGVEACIRRFPAQYYWAYMRFRRRPAGEPPFYPW